MLIQNNVLVEVPLARCDPVVPCCIIGPNDSPLYVFDSVKPDNKPLQVCISTGTNQAAALRVMYETLMGKAPLINNAPPKRCPSWHPGRTH